MSWPVIVGHEPIRARLLAAAAHDRLAHALLFAGPAGVGKALMARDLAARLLCEGNPLPCGECDSCVQLAAGSHPDLVAVALPDGKKEIGIDLVRKLKHVIQLRAVRGRRKIALIDQADRLSIAAQNALLKTLEEPPAQSLFVLISASPRSLLPTIRSRCQLIAFRPLTTDEVAAALHANAGIEPAAAAALAPSADGSPGRALQLREVVRGDTARSLQQLLAELDMDRYVTVASMAKALGRTEQEMMMRLNLLQSWFRDLAVGAIYDDDSTLPAPRPRIAGDVTRALNGATAIAEAIQNLQRRNPNRPLLAEALLLRLARG